MRILLRLLPLLLLAPGLADCTHRSPLIIAITKASPNYVKWIKAEDTTIQFVDLYRLTPDSALAVLENCSGLLVTGGEDVYPAWYGREADTGLCTGFDRRRDTLEMALIRRAIGKKMPILGICRGEQIINVTLGGTLLVDIPTEKGTAVTHQCDDYTSCYHWCYPVHGTTLYRICQLDSAQVASNHHQAVDVPARGLRVNAYSADTLAEGIEWADPAGKSFLLGVQWHPERMDYDNALSHTLIREFLTQNMNYLKSPKQ